DEPGTGHRLYRGRRTGRGHAQVDPPAQGGPEPLLPQEARPRRLIRRSVQTRKAAHGGPPFFVRRGYLFRPSSPGQPPLVNRATSSKARGRGVVGGAAMNF